jgi:hypothetical protein
MNHTNSGTCNTGEEETEGKEREKKASKQAEERIGNREEKPIGQRSADRLCACLGFAKFRVL